MPSERIDRAVHAGAEFRTSGSGPPIERGPGFGAAATRSGRRELGKHGEHLLVRGYLPLLRADGVELHNAVAVDHEECRTLPQAQCATPDVVGVEALVVGVGEDLVRHRMSADIPSDRFGGLSCDRYYRRTVRGELRVVVAQLREMPTAERSREPSQEHQDNGSVNEEIIQRHDVAGRAEKRESRRRGSN